MEFGLMQPGQEAPVIDLVTEVFNHCVAPGYEANGVTEFFKHANKDLLSERAREGNLIILAMEGKQIRGMLEIENLRHISLFFVRCEHQRQGIGKALLKEAVHRIQKTQKEALELTVNSSPNAVDAYKRYGFMPTDTLQCSHGIRFVPMTLAPVAMNEQPIPD